MSSAFSARFLSASALADPAQKLELLLRLCGLTDSETVLGELHGLLVSADGLDGFLINLTNLDGSGMVCRRAHLTDEYRSMESTVVGTLLPLDRPDILCRAIAELKAVDLTDAGRELRDPSTFSARFPDWGFAGVVAVPIADTQGAVGAVTLLRAENGWDRAFLDNLQGLLSLFAPVLRQTRYYASVLKREAALRDGTGEKQRFLDFVNHVNRLTSPAAVRTRVAQEFLERYPFDLVGFLSCDDQRLTLDDVVLRPPFDPQIRTDLIEHVRKYPYQIESATGATPLSYLQQTSFYFRDIQDILNLPMAWKDRQGLALMRSARTGLIIPISHQGRSTGVLWLVNLSREVEVPEADRNLIQSLATFLGSALENAAAFERAEQGKAEVETANRSLRGQVRELDRLASHDRLTGLYNFGSFEQALAREVAERADGQCEPLSLVVIDIDHFKRFNDSYGHDAGNEILQAVAKRLQHLCRDQDIVCRYGGEEFVLILPSCDADGAHRLAERIRQDLDHHPVHQQSAVTVSAGCATLGVDEEAATLFKRADAALYQAKNNGRNRVESAD